MSLAVSFVTIPIHVRLALCVTTLKEQHQLLKWRHLQYIIQNHRKLSMQNAYSLQNTELVISNAASLPYHV